MFFRQISPDLRLNLSIPSHAEELFELTNSNRVFLQQWLPWLDGIQKPVDTETFLSKQLLRYQRGEALCITIFYQGKIAGVVGYNQIDRHNDIGHIGYWLGQEYNGLGIMTESVRDLILVGREYYHLNRIDIRCAVENNRSRKIPERLGFNQEGIIRQAAKLGDGYIDLVIYGLVFI